MSASKVTFQDRLHKVGLRVWAFLLIISALIFAANFGMAAYYAGQITSASALSFGLQVDAQKLSRYATEAIGGREEAFAELQGTRDAIAGAVTALGGLVGYFLVGQLHDFLPYFLAVASSSFIYVALADLIPQLQKRLTARETVSQIAWLIAGMVIVTLVSGAAHAH